VRLVHFEDGKLEIALEPSAAKTLIGDLAQRLGALTGRRWMVVVSAQAGAPTVRARIEAQQAEFSRGAEADPLVRNVLARFPGAEIVAVRRPERDAVPLADDEQAPPVDDDAAFASDRPDDRTDHLDDDP